MTNGYINSSVNLEFLLNDKNTTAEKYVLKNNDSTIQKICSFFNSGKSILLLNGFAGTGKKQITESFLNNATAETVVYRFVCTNSSTIEDLYLNLNVFFKKAFKNITNSDYNILTSYKDKAQYVFARMDRNFILAFYNFDNLLSENKEAFLTYINALTDIKNLKMIIESRVFDSSALTEQNSYTKIMVRALSMELFESYFRDYDIKLTSSKIEQFYRLTRGYFLYCSLTLKLLINQGESVEDFLTRYFASGQSYDKFLAAEYYKLIVGTTKNSFNLFLQLRHGINVKALYEIGTFPDTVLKTLADNFFIYKVNDMYYPTNFLVTELKDGVKDVVYKSKLVKYYTAMTEKSVDDRDFLISRESLMNEITYFSETDMTVKVEKEKLSQPKIEPSTQVKEEVKKENEEITNLGPEELIEKTKEALIKYDYIQALKYLSTILTNPDSYKRQELINSAYCLLVTAYSKLSKWEYCLYYLNLLEDYYKSTANNTEYYNIAYEKANIFYKQNKIIDSINLLKRILANTQEKQILVKTNLLLANIALLANNRQLGATYVKTAINDITNDTEMIVKSELYFKYALLSDENGEEELAIKFYERCINLDSAPNKYIALSYSNLGEIYYDKDDNVNAMKNFEKACEVEKAIENNYGIYYTLAKIVELTPKEQKEQRLKMMTDARDYAIKSRDNETIIESTIALGDMYYDYSMPQDALIEYFNLFKQGKEIIAQDNLQKLRARIRDIKARIRKEEFEKLAPGYE